MKRVEQMIESFLWNSRYVVFLAVASSLIASFVLFIMATIDVLKVITYIFGAYVATGAFRLFSEYSEELHNFVVTHVVGAVDDYLLATVLLIFSLGLYELFISKIENAEKDSLHSSQILLIKNLDDLKDRLAKVILMILIVTFFKNTIHTSFEQPLNILYLGGGIFLIAISFYFTFRPTGSK
jgi:uncharacterized membrane protein YqhA